MLLPSRLPDKTEAGIVLPESFVKKSNRGVCVKIGGEQWERFLGQEVFFPQNVEYVVEDAELEIELYIVQADHVILLRQPPKETIFARLSREEGGEHGGFKIATLQRSLS